MISDQRPLSVDDAEAAFALRAQAFNVPAGDRDRYLTRFRPDQHLGAFVDDRLIASLAVLPLGQWFGGRSVPMGGLASVAVAPEHRNTGVASRLMRLALSLMRDRGQVISTLYPATNVPYRRLGWELAGARVRRRLPLRTLADLPRPPVQVVGVDVDADLDRVRAVYDRVAATTDGFTDRTGDRWRTILDHLTRHDHTYVYAALDDDGELDGYVAYRHEEPPPDADEFYRLRVIELVAGGGAATAALWRLLAANRGVSATVSWYGGLHEPLSFVVDEQDARIEDDWHWMTRLVDVAGAVAARGYPTDAHVTVQLALVDEVAPWNGGRWVLEVRDGKGLLTPGGAGTVRTTVGALAPLYSGLASPWGLARVGLLEGATGDDLRALGRAFAGPSPWMLDFF